LQVLAAFFLAIAVSLDGFGAGVAYGMRKIRVPIISMVVVSLASGISIWLAMSAGHFFAVYIPFAQQVGALILIGIGLGLVYQNTQASKNYERRENRENKVQPHETVMALHLKPFGIIIHIMREPLEADRDRSGLLSWKEAILLGVALAVDAMAAGIGAAMAGFSPVLLTPFVVMTKFIFLVTGLILGESWVSSWSDQPIVVLIPGAILVGLGVYWLI
jgi:putative sporulation protein YtaF